MGTDSRRTDSLGRRIVRTKIVLALTLVVYLTTGRAPGVREPRNPDGEQGGARVAVMAKRGWAA